MKKDCASIFSVAILFFIPALQADQNSYLDLCTQYGLHYVLPTDINEHLPALRRYAAQCGSVVELGGRNAHSTWGLLLGLAESNAPHKSYIGVDIAPPVQDHIEAAEHLAKANGIHFQFWMKNDIEIEIEETDLLMIDTLHTYAQLTCELERFSSKIRHYIIMHDTSHPYEYQDEQQNTPINYTYPAFIDQTKRGIWTAVVEFLARHPEWCLHERFLNNYGLTVLKRR